MANRKVLQLISLSFSPYFPFKGIDDTVQASRYSRFIKLKGLFSSWVLFMAKKKNTKKKNVPVKTDVNSVEKDTLDRVSRTLRIIGEFLARWDASAKPKDMIPEIERIRHFHDDLLHWQADAMKPHPKEHDEDKVERLEAFVDICLSYS